MWVSAFTAQGPVPAGLACGGSKEDWLPVTIELKQGDKITTSALIEFATGSVVRVFGAPINPLRRLQISLAFLCVATAASGQEPVNPLKPLDLSSPRATLKTFLDVRRRRGRVPGPGLPAVSFAREIQSPFSLAKPVVECLDLSEVAPAARRKAGFSAASRLVRNVEPDPASAV